MRLRGDWAMASTEAERARDELQDFIPFDAGGALNEIGEIRLRIGDLAGAERLSTKHGSWARIHSQVGRCCC